MADDLVTRAELGAIVDAQIAARLVAVGERIGGVLLAVIHVFDMLDRQRVLSRSDAITSLQEARKGLSPVAPARMRTALRQIEQALESIEKAGGAPSGSDPETLRKHLQLIPGGLSDDAPETSD